MGTVTQPSSSGLGGDGSACEDWSLMPEELGCEKNPFLEMSQDQIQKLDAVLSSEQAKALLQETTHRQLLDDPEEKLVAMLGGAPGAQANQESSQAQLPREIVPSLEESLKDLDNLMEPKPDDILNVLEQASGPDLFPGAAEDEDVANMAKEILGSDLDESVLELDVVLLDHCYSMLPADFVKSPRVRRQEHDDSGISAGASTSTSTATVTKQPELIKDSVEVPVQAPPAPPPPPPPTSPPVPVASPSASGAKSPSVTAKAPEPSPPVKPSPVRRSQRQIDKIEREQLEKIRAENAEMQRREREEMEKLKALQQQQEEEQKAEKAEEDKKADALKNEDSRESESSHDVGQKARHTSKGKTAKSEDLPSDKEQDADDEDSTTKKGKRGKRRSVGKKMKDTDSQDEQGSSKGAPKKGQESSPVNDDDDEAADDSDDEDEKTPKRGGGRKRRGRSKPSRCREGEDENKLPEGKGSVPMKKSQKIQKLDVEAAVERLHASPPKKNEKASPKKKLEKLMHTPKMKKKGSKDDDDDDADEKFNKKMLSKKEILEKLSKKGAKKSVMEKSSKHQLTDDMKLIKSEKVLKKALKGELLHKGKVVKLLSEATRDEMKKHKLSMKSEKSPRERKISEADSIKSETSDGSHERKKLMSKKEAHKKALARRESMQLIPAELEPALFSTPDVMVKKRSSLSSQDGGSSRKDSFEKEGSEDQMGRNSLSESSDEKSKVDSTRQNEPKVEVKGRLEGDVNASEYAETVAEIEKAIMAEADKLCDLKAATKEIMDTKEEERKLMAKEQVPSSNALKNLKTEVQNPMKIQQQDIEKSKIQTDNHKPQAPKEKDKGLEKRSLSTDSRTSKGSNADRVKEANQKERRHSVASGPSHKNAEYDKKKRHPDMFRRLKKKSKKERSSSPRKGMMSKQEKKERSDAPSSGEEMSYSDNPDDSDWCSEDDPDRPWCICRKPHDDRFMICCDLCHDWFHGSCVGVTRSQGRQWEKEGKEWVCPQCSKVPDDKIFPVTKQEKVVEKADRKPSISSSQPPAQQMPEKKNHQVNTNKNIQVKKCTWGTCGKPVMPNAAFCSMDCLEKHGMDALEYLKQMREKIGGAKGGNEKPATERRVLVIDRQTNKLVTGMNAPTEANLMEWLRLRPNFAVVKPGAPKVVKVPPPPPPAVEKTEAAKPQPAPPKPEDSNSSSGPDPVRLNVRKTLRDALAARCKDADDILLSADEIKNIAVHIEEALFKLFKDIGSKYKARYRSLVFNIKDVKNQGLFRKILRGKIQPERLVKMSPEELASQELAKWRERENKHALEMIQREQLEQQQQLKSGHLIKKTHKGEVEIEDEDLKLFELAETQQKQKAASDSPFSDSLVDTTDQHRSHLFDLNCKVCTGKVAPPAEEPGPKKARVARTILVESSSIQSKEEITVVKQETPETKTAVKAPPPPPPPPKKVSVTEESSDHEPSSTVCLSSPDSVVTSQSESAPAPPPPSRAQKDKSTLSVWKGFISMQEVSKFVTSAHKVSGPTDFLSQDIPDTIQVCGRISPDQVWDYLSKIKQSGNKELIIIRFQPANEEEKMGYGVLYSYLSTRKRYGVVGNHARMIKDFYIVPLASYSPVPTVLIPFDGPGLDAIRPHLLLGVIVRHKSRQSQGTGSSQSSRSKSVEKYEPYEPSYTPPINSFPSKSPGGSPTSRKHSLSESQDTDERSYTPPLEKMPKLLDVDNRTSANQPKGETTSIDDADKPYDPEESDVGLNPSLGNYRAGSNTSSMMPSLLTGSAVSSQSVIDLIDQISKGSNPAELTTRMLASIASSTDLEQQKHLLMELTQKVEEQKKQLEQERLRTLGVTSLNLASLSSITKTSLSPPSPGPSGSSTPLYSENPSATTESFLVGTSANSSKGITITSESLAMTASSISLPPKLQEMLDSVRKKSLEKDSQPLPKLYSPVEQTTTTTTNILVDDPIVKKYSVTPDEMGDIDLRVNPFAPVPAKEPPAREEVPREDTSTADKRIDPRLKGKSYQQDPRTKSQSKEKVEEKNEPSVGSSNSSGVSGNSGNNGSSGNNTGSSLSSMSASELVEKARKQLEEMEAMEKAQQAAVTPQPTVPPPTYSAPHLLSTNIQSQQPPPPGVDPCDLVQSATHTGYSAPPLVRTQEGSATSGMSMYTSTSMSVSAYTSHTGTYSDLTYGYSTAPATANSGQNSVPYSTISLPTDVRSNSRVQGVAAAAAVHAPPSPVIPPMAAGSHGYCAPATPFATPYPPAESSSSTNVEGTWYGSGNSSTHKQDRDERRQWNQSWRRRGEWSQKKDNDRRPYSRNSDRWSRESANDRDFRDKGWQQSSKWQSKSKRSDEKNKDKDWRKRKD